MAIRGPTQSRGADQNHEIETSLLIVGLMPDSRVNASQTEHLEPWLYIRKIGKILDKVRLARERLTPMDEEFHIGVA